MSDEIFEVVSAGNLAAVQACIARDPSAVRARNSQGLSPIQTAFFMGQYSIVAALLTTEPQLDAFEAAIVGDAEQLAARLDEDHNLLTACSPDGWTLMHLASWAGQPETTRLLLDRSADLTAVSVNPLRNQPLNAAVAGPNTETRTACVRLLLAAGADVNNRQVNGNTPLHTAAHMGDIATVEALLAHGADTGLRSDDGKSAADYARAGGHEALATRLEVAQVGD